MSVVDSRMSIPTALLKNNILTFLANTHSLVNHFYAELPSSCKTVISARYFKEQRSKEQAWNVAHTEALQKSEEEAKKTILCAKALLRYMHQEEKKRWLLEKKELFPGVDCGAVHLKEKDGSFSDRWLQVLLNSCQLSREEKEEQRARILSSNDYQLVLDGQVAVSLFADCACKHFREHCRRLKEPTTKEPHRGIQPLVLDHSNCVDLMILAFMDVYKTLLKIETLFASVRQELAVSGRERCRSGSFLILTQDKDKEIERVLKVQEGAKMRLCSVLHEHTLSNQPDTREKNLITECRALADHFSELIQFAKLYVAREFPHKAPDSFSSPEMRRTGSRIRGSSSLVGLAAAIGSMSLHPQEGELSRSPSAIELHPKRLVALLEGFSVTQELFQTIAATGVPHAAD